MDEEEGVWLPSIEFKTEKLQRLSNELSKKWEIHQVEKPLLDNFLT